MDEPVLSKIKINPSGDPLLKQYANILRMRGFRALNWYRDHSYEDAFQQLWINTRAEQFAILHAAPVFDITMTLGLAGKEGTWYMVTNGVGLKAPQLGLMGISFDSEDIGSLFSKLDSLSSEMATSPLTEESFEQDYASRLLSFENDASNNVAYSLYGKDMPRSEYEDWYIQKLMLKMTNEVLAEGDDAELEEENSRPVIARPVGKQALKDLPSALQEYQEKIAATRKSFIKITPKLIETPLKPWQSKYLGLPYQPPGFEYPEDANGAPLQFLAQINLAEVPALDDYPDSGIVQFYIADDDLMGMEFSDPYDEQAQFQLQTSQRNYRVIYHADVIEDLELLNVSVRGNDPEIIEGPCRLQFAVCHEYMPAMDYAFDTVMGEDFFEQFKDDEGEMEGSYMDLIYSDGNKIGGYPNFTQDDIRHIVPADEEWVLLLQIDESEHVDIMWGDSGVGNFFIEKSALKNLDFSRVLYNWDCG